MCGVLPRAEDWVGAQQPVLNPLMLMRRTTPAAESCALCERNSNMLAVPIRGIPMSMTPHCPPPPLARPRTP